jgi:dTDP-glucose 4,6-dehydratase
MHVVVTGAAGFIASNFIRRIQDDSFQGISKVMMLDKMTYAGVKENLNGTIGQDRFSLVVGDICDPELVCSVVSEADAIINFAAESHVDRSITDATEFVKTNIGGVQVLLDAIKATDRNIRFIQVSTDEVYGSIQSGTWNENSPLLPNSPYSASKAGGELLARSYHRTHGLDVITTRCSNNYGTHHFPEKLIPLFITNLLEGKKVTVYGNGLNIRDWVHVDDHCRGIYQVLMNGRSGQVYNIGGGRELTNLQITLLILEVMGEDDSAIAYVRDRKGHDFRYSIDWSKINKELGYEPQIRFEDGLRETVAWYQNNREWWEPLKRRAGL